MNMFTNYSPLLINLQNKILTPIMATVPPLKLDPPAGSDKVTDAPVESLIEGLFTDGFQKDFSFFEVGNTFDHPVYFLFWLIIGAVVLFSVFKFILAIMKYFNSDDIRQKEEAKKAIKAYGISMLAATLSLLAIEIIKMTLRVGIG